MSTNYEIVDGIETPVSTKTHRSKYYPFENMEVEQAFFFNDVKPATVRGSYLRWRKNMGYDKDSFRVIIFENSDPLYDEGWWCKRII